MDKSVEKMGGLRGETQQAGRWKMIDLIGIRDDACLGRFPLVSEFPIKFDD